ncbi:unnamed protein product [Schistosoma margrebowiei]|uniref:Uncharacterized protein n=1 Tax=Schistosoma margrebowiei TaxID=48269 RepID=A0A183LC24_9TREM|nr:unnamed protein product [Schistosoma margrebowiei]
MVVEGSRQETLDLGFVLLGTLQIDTILHSIKLAANIVVNQKHSFGKT